MTRIKRWQIKVLFAIMCLLAVASLIHVIFAVHNVKPEVEREYHLLTDQENWTYQAGTEDRAVEFGALVPVSGSELVILREIYPEELGENALLFPNNRQCVEVRVDGVSIYQLGTGPRQFKFSTSTYCAVPLPQLGRPYTLEVRFFDLKDGTCEVPTLFLGSRNDILIFLCLADIVTIASLPLFFLFGVVLVLLAVFLLLKKIPEPRIISIAAFLLCVVIWGLSDMYMVCLLPIDMEVASSISHYMMMLMPVPILYFVRGSCRSRRLRLFKPLFLVLAGNIILQSALFLLGIASLHQMLLLSQFFIVFMLFYGTVAVVLDYRANRTNVGRVQSAAFLIAASTGVLIMLSYWVVEGRNNLYSQIFQIGIFIFLLAMLAVLMFSVEQHNYEVRVKDAELDAYRSISNTDQLTGLLNRRAFDLRMKEIQGDPEGYPDALLVFMDLNGLKYANDKFGHLAGDELIIAAARCIRTAFEGAGDTYRIGGDEFAAILPGAMLNTVAYYARMDAAISAYNETATVPLSLARGYCTLRDQGGHRRTDSDWKMLADKKMYEDKVINHRLNPQGSAEAYLEIISSFVSAVDAKDSYTANHSERVGLMADRICHMLGLSSASADQIHMAACLHDIGKIGIPDAILTKVGPLTDEEWNIMQSHPVVGEEILKQTRAFYDVSQIIRSHHERIDGKGYPDGKSGTEIPLGARIISIADSIDAMTSSRSYRQAKPLAFCRAEIERNLGVMYDPTIGGIVLEHWEEIEEIVLSQRG